jgi:hypothetical protein
VSREKPNCVTYDDRRKAKPRRPIPGDVGYEEDGSEYTAVEALYLAACEKYRSANGLLFLRATDYLKVLLSLGYRRVE